ncbi:unnamed protein product [Polarella glacialis]|uniref:Uncharacterized protein n=1 Tax=Polarella glacialis TaxID=89957 RepID=A0A813FCZ6_POLGL|nr:unnamed protein product [Polarella glacialis]
MLLAWQTSVAFTSRHARSSNSLFRSSATSGLHTFSSTFGLDAPPEFGAHGCQRSAALCNSLRPLGQLTWTRGFAAGPGRPRFWATAEGRSKTLNFISTHHPRVDASAMTPAWWAGSIEYKSSALSVKCRVCGYHSRRSRLSNILVGGQGFPCFCNGTVPWASREGYIRCKEVLGSSRFDHIDHSGIEWDWWQSNVSTRFSKLPVWCRSCGQEAASMIQNICNLGRGFGCACKQKTELKLLKWLQLHFGTDGRVDREVHGCINPATGHRLRIDFRVKGRIMIELDGWLHFCGKDFSGNPFDQVPRRDLMKERWAEENGYVLIRVLQMDVWSDLGNWDSFMLNSIAEAELDSRPRVIVPDVPEYKTGIYHNLRDGSRVDSRLQK